MLSEAFGSVLRSGRAEFNRRFSEARKVNPNLDAAMFSRMLETCADPLVSAIHRVSPDQTAAVAGAAYDASLELVMQGLIGSAKYEPWIQSLWQRVLVPAAPILAVQPQRAIASFCNALHHLVNAPGARPGPWLASIEGLLPQCRDLETLLRAGQVAAWRAGLAHFRLSALAAAETLPDAVALAAAGFPASAGWTEVRQRLLADPWYGATNTVVEYEPIRVAAEAGGFRGFGGLFQAPPAVTCHQDHFYACSGDEVWLLTADAFGATFHRASAAEFAAGEAGPDLPKGWRVGKTSVTDQQSSLEFDESGVITSFAANTTTLALTFSLSHSITLIPTHRTK